MAASQYRCPGIRETGRNCRGWRRGFQSWVNLVDKNGKIDKQANPVNLEQWAKEQLTNLDKNGQVLFIQAGPGRGKSVFCRIFANWVREHLHPIWTPIMIRLRDIDAFENNIENTLRAAVKADFVKSDDGWLTDRNTRFLFVLDGFDELRIEGRTTGGIEKFLKQVGNYQSSCQHNLFREAITNIGFSTTSTGELTSATKTSASHTVLVYYSPHPPTSTVLPGMKILNGKTCKD
ncbi:NACHT domain-containing protein [Coleofasciculus sp. G2-EDA-02]|uniref:NACHT domain-containing protein n=1 Tax=Coleofasciculus sp. G2-EDA-02 TaxID=3069529 RepID=UPI0032F755FC